MSFGELPILESGAISNVNNGRWTQASGTNAAFVRGAGRGGSGISSQNGAWYSGSNNVSTILGQVLVGSYTSLWAGAAYFGVYNGITSDLMRINLDNSPDSGCPGVRLQILGNGALQVILTRGGGSASTSSSFSLNNRPLIASAWYFIEMGIVVSGGNTITVDVYINDVHVLSAYAATFTAFTSTNLNRVWFISNASIAGLSDLYINNSGFYGDGYVFLLVPNGAGTYTDWTSSTINPNWQNVDEYPPSSAAYNYSATVGNDDSYTMTDLPSGYTDIKAVQSNNWAAKDASGTAGFKALYVSAATPQLGTQEFNPQVNSFVYYREGSELSPFTGVAWTAAELNAIEFGQERTS